MHEDTGGRVLRVQLSQLTQTNGSGCTALKRSIGHTETLERALGFCLETCTATLNVTNFCSETFLFEEDGLSRLVKCFLEQSFGFCERERERDTHTHTHTRLELSKLAFYAQSTSTIKA